MFPIRLFDTSDEGQADKKVPIGVGAKLKLGKLPKASHIMGPGIILAAMGIGMGEFVQQVHRPLGVDDVLPRRICTDLEYGFRRLRRLCTRSSRHSLLKRSLSQKDTPQ